jgi:NAD(P)-dependent dehydrogenase (short-subunit alcohol dehydrogenase family)
MTKIAVITGANRGLGFATARRLGQSGVKVIVGARTLADGERAAGRLRREGLDSEALHLDIDSPASVRQAKAFLAPLRRSAAGRIVNISSTMGSLTDQTDPSSPYYGLVVPA